jgi:predicted extracellular nuclease
VLVIESGGASSVEEGGGGDSLSLALRSQPLADVVVAVDSGVQLTAAVSNLRFTPANWSIPQTLNIAAVDDLAVEGAHSGLLRFSLSSADPAYQGLVVPDRTVTISDNDRPGLPPTLQLLAPKPWIDLPATGSGGFLGAVINDPSDPARTLGIAIQLADPDTASAGLQLSVQSSNASVVGPSGLQLSGSGADRLLTIAPAGVGLTTITLTVSDGGSSASSSFTYGASAAAASPAVTRFHGGASDASSAIAIDADWMLVADDEDQVLRLVNRQQSGLAAANFTMEASLGLVGASEVDLEASTRSGATLYWLGSHSNNASGDDRPNRERLFATALSGSGAGIGLTPLGSYAYLEDDLLAWDQAMGGSLGLAASAAAGVPPEQPGGFNIEGLAMGPDGTTAYLGFRAPTQPTNNRQQALIVPLLNIAELIRPGGGSAGTARFGTPIQLDLGGRGIRSIDRNAAGDYLIIAGPSGAASGVAPDDFRLYRWSGVATDAPLLLSADINALLGGSGSAEAIVDVPASLTATSSLQLLVDDGDTVWYGNGVISKDLESNAGYGKPLQKFRSLQLSLGTPVLPAGGLSLASGYQQNFNSLISTGTTTWSDGLLPGWSVRRTGSGTSLAASTGSNTAGNLYSFGSSGASDRALGSIGSGNATAGSFSWGLRLFNDTGSRLDRVYLSYRGEQWRNSGAPAQSLNLEWRIGGSELNGGSWSAVPSLAFSSPISGGSAGLLDGNLAANSRLLSGVIEGLNLPAGADLWLRWSDPDHSGSDHGLAIDDLTIATSPLPALQVLPSGGGSAVAEGDRTGDSVTVSLVTNPSSPVTISLSGDGQVQLSSDGVSFSNSLTLVLNDSRSQAIAVRAVDDDLVEGDHLSSVSFLLSSADPAYNGLVVPDLLVSVSDNDRAVQITPIHTIQGTGASSPLQGQTVTVEGIVVASFPGSGGLSGFFLQEEDGDADQDSRSSEGIFVYDPAALFVGGVGERVRLSGTVAEYLSSATGLSGAPVASSLTQITALTALERKGNAALPTAATLLLPVAEALDLEAVEGMAVTVLAASGPLTVTNTFGLGRYGQVGLSSDGRLSQFTQINAPDAAAYGTYLEALSKRTIQLDDGSTRQNPDPVIHGRGGEPLSALNPLRGGDTIASISGVLDQRFDGYRVQSASGANFQATNPRSSTAPAVQGTLKIAGFNLLNYFNGNGSGAADAAGGFPTARGANTLEEFERQRAKTVAAILGLESDIIAYNELENDGYGSSSAAQQLVDGLNQAVGANVYSFIRPAAGLLQADGRFGADEISVGFLYRSDRVRQAAGTSVAALQSGSFDQGSNRIQRPALAVSFERLDAGVATGEQLTTVVTHLKSKGSSAGGSGDADAGDGQGLSNGSRTRAAAELADWLASSPTGLNDPDVLILGDLNSYLKEDPITALAARGYQSLYGPDSYSYQFNGQWGSLDHMLASASLAAQLGSARKWAINSDEAVVLDYNTEFKSASQINSFYNADPFRSSDHDPLLAGFLLNPSNRGAASFTINGTSAVGQTLIAALTTSDPDGEGAFAYSWQSSPNGRDWTGVGTNSNSYSIAPADEGKQLRLVVSYTDLRGFAETITVAANPVPLMPDLAIFALTPSQSEGSIGSTSFAFQINRSGDLSASSRVSWGVEGSGSNPTNSADFALNQSPSGTATFATGQDSLIITIPVIGDSTVEPDESFRVLLSSASNGRITPANASATSLILNDDLPAQTFSFTASPTTVFEGNAVAIGVITTNVPAGSRLYWQASGPGITPSDFSGGGLNGDVLIGGDGRSSFTRTIAADAVIDPDETLEIRFFSDMARSLQVGAPLNLTIKEPSVGLSTDSNDVITGSAAGERLNGVPSGSILRGRGSRDELTGQAGDDVFVLGDASGPYYDDNQPANRGTTDMAIIRDFSAGDRIQLWGTSSMYSLVSTLNAGISGVRIDLKPINSIISGVLPEAIGFVRGATLASLNLSSSTQFLYQNL